jgi:predicted AAA+ superfamily ATPase
MYNRLLSLPNNQSFFLFGQRGVGKSHLIRTSFAPEHCLTLNLLDSRLYLQLSKEPWKLREIVAARTSEQVLVVIDEVQKIPELLDEVHLLIEEHGVIFGLTGSSARKLKSKGANLLAGRALSYRLYPLTRHEIDKDFLLEKVLQWGALPKTITEQDDAIKEEYLYSYASTYLKEEILQEQTVRDIEPFNRFLEVAAQSNGDVISYENIAKDIKVSGPTVKNYYQILEDTLLGFYLHPYHTSVRKRHRTAPKFYFYDLGIVRTLQNTILQKPVPGTFEYGMLFEGFIINEIIRMNEYLRKRFSFSYLRFANDREIDLVIERPGQSTILVEIKSREEIDERHVSTLEEFLPEFPGATALCISRVPQRIKVGNVLVVPWEEGIQIIFEGL